MSIIQSIVKVYDDQQKTTLITSVTTQGASTAIPVDELDEGEEYWVTAQVEDDSHLQSNESAPYRFYTLPDVTWHTGSPGSTDSTISAQLDVTTHVVNVSRWGICYDTNSSFTNPTYYDGANQGYVDVTGLTEHTRYYLRPYIIDEFNRRWVNIDVETNIWTRYAKPVVTWTGVSTVGVTTWQNQINVTSTDTISSIVVSYQAQGGPLNTMNLTPQTGTQSVSLTGLTANTQYSVTVRATNSAGYTDSSTQTFSTYAGSVQVDALSAVVNNSNNNIAASGRAQANDASVTITGLDLELFTNNSHTGTAAQTIQGTSPYTSVSGTFNVANPDTTYYVFAHATYTVGSDPTVYDSWSTPITAQTYAMLSFGSITTTNNSASIAYSVSGTALSDDIAYSTDNTNWTSIPVSTLSGGTLSLTSLTPSTSYYLRGRCQSAAGWQDYVTTTFATTGTLPVVTVTSVTNITPTEAQVNLAIS